MKLPMMWQKCVVEYRGAQHVGFASKAGLNDKGQYRISVWSRGWGYDMDFQSGDVRLAEFKFDDGTVYDAHAAFSRKYSVAELTDMFKAENAPAPQRSLPHARPLPPACPPARIVRRPIRT